MGVLFFLLMKLLAMVLVHGYDSCFTHSADDEWIDIGTQTVYYIERHRPARWIVAWHTCASKVPGGRLAKFESKNEMLLLRSYLKDVPEYLWIGLSTDGESPFLWTDNTPPAFANWEKKEPQHVYDSCVELNATTMAWRATYPCYPKRLYICAADKDTEWIDTGNRKVYYIERQLKTQWESANNICSSLGQECFRSPGRLANFENKNEMLLLHNHLNNIPDYLWIGLRKHKRAPYVWTFDSPLGFTNWEEGEPHSLDFFEGCVRVSTETMAWKEINCYSDRHFICVFDKVSSSGSRQLPEIGEDIVITFLILSILVTKCSW